MNKKQHKVGDTVIVKPTNEVARVIAIRNVHVHVKGKYGTTWYYAEQLERYRK